MNNPKTPKLHPQTLGKNKFANPPKEQKTPVASPPAPATQPLVKTETPKPVASAPPPKPPATPGKDLNRFEITVKLTGSDEPAFAVDVPLTGDGAADQAAARALAKRKHPGKAMIVISSRIFTRTENCLLEIPPGSTLSSLFGPPGGITEDLIEIGRAVHDGSRGAVFIRNLRSHIGLAFRPSMGGLVIFSNRIVSNRLASELPLIVAEVLGNNAREIQIYLK